MTESKRATAPAVAQRQSPIGLYHRVSQPANIINEVPARLLFSLQSPPTTFPERETVLNAIDGLIRLKIDTGLLMEV